MDGSEAVEWEEFCVLMYRLLLLLCLLWLLLFALRKMREKDPDNEIREAFRVFDAEGVGYIGQKYMGLEKITQQNDIFRGRGIAGNFPPVARADFG